MNISGLTKEQNISMFLDTFVYMDQNNKKWKDKDINYIISKINISKLKEDQKVAYDAVRAFISKNPELGELRLSYQSETMGEDYIGAKATAFYSVDENENPVDLYVAYRGTGDMRWYDNGEGLACVSTPYQENGSKFFDYVAENFNNASGIEDLNVVVTGHSKGGNIAQFTTLFAKNAYLIDSCNSVDGQGFSPEAIEYIKDKYGEAYYQQQVQKMTSICGNNDYVNGLGITVIPQEKTIYINSHTEMLDLVGGHTITELYSYELGENNEKIFNGNINEIVEEQEELAVFVKKLSENIMKLDPESRKKSCVTIMQVMENMDGGKTGLLGEKANIDDYISFLKLGSFSILYTNTQEEFSKVVIRELTEKEIEKALKDMPESEINAYFTVSILLMKILALNEVEGKVNGTLAYITCIGINLEKTKNKIDELVAANVEYGIQTISYCIEVYNMSILILEVAKLMLDKNYASQKKYISDNPIIEIDTELMDELADRLERVNMKLLDIDFKIDGLYKKVGFTDFKRLLNLLRADIGVSYDLTLERCVEYMRGTAEEFRKVESEIVNMTS